jgi:hypothetical protein
MSERMCENCRFTKDNMNCAWADLSGKSIVSCGSWQPIPAPITIIDATEEYDDEYLHKNMRTMTAEEAKAYHDSISRRSIKTGIKLGELISNTTKLLEIISKQKEIIEELIFDLDCYCQAYSSNSPYARRHTESLIERATDLLRKSEGV